MLKFLRKYNKWILVVGGAMLMVAFLMPQMLQELGRGVGAHSAYMRVDGAKVSLEDHNLAQQELNLLRELGMGDKSQRVDWWLLVTREAQKAGLVGGVQSGRDVLPQLVDDVAMRIYYQAQFQGQRPDMAKVREQAQIGVERGFIAAANASRLTSDQAHLALAKLQGVSRLQSSYNDGLFRVSDRRTTLVGKESLDSARIDYIFITGDFAPTFGAGAIPAPDDAALAALFDRFKAVKRGEGDFGIGYTLPPRVKVEWIKLDRQAWDKSVRVDPLEVANRYLRDNKGKAGVAASGPEFDAARPTIEATLRKEALDRAMAEATKTIRAEIARTTLKLEKAGEVYALPPDWDQRRPDLNKLRDDVAARVKTEARLDVQPPDVARRDAAWLTADDLRQLPGIGSASVRRGNNAIPFPQLAVQTRELQDAAAVASGIQNRVPFGPIEDSFGNQYFFTILDSRKESAPDSWTEVREQLEKDYRKFEGFKLLEKHAPALAAQSATDGLDAMAKLTAPTPVADTTDIRTPIEVRKATMVTRQSGLSPELNTDEIKNAIIKAAAQFDPTKDLETVDAASRTLTLPNPKSLGVAVVRITGYTPLTNEKLRQSDFSLARQAQQDALKDLKDNPFTLPRLRERLKVEYASGKTPEEEASESADSGA